MFQIKICNNEKNKASSKTAVLRCDKFCKNTGLLSRIVNAIDRLFFVLVFFSLLRTSPLCVCES